MANCYILESGKAPQNCSGVQGLSWAAEIEVDYLRGHKDGEREYFSSLPWRLAILNAGHAVWYGRNNKPHVFPHQYRVRKAARSNWASVLTASASQLAAATTFDVLIQRLNDIRIVGVGEVFLYDTATRLAANLKLPPTSRVYLHAGTRIGACNLGLSTRRAWIPIEEFRAYFPRLSADQIEDVLCIYKNELARIRQH